MIYSLGARPAGVAFVRAKGFVQGTITENISRRYTLGRPALWLAITASRKT
jgi:hypothetical protein